MTTIESKPWPLRHLPAERLTSAIGWAGYVGSDNIEAIADRVSRIVVPGRSFTLIHQDREFAPAEINSGVTLYMGEAYRKNISWSCEEHGGGMSVNLTPGITGFGINYDRDWNPCPTVGMHPMTSLEVRNRIDRDPRFDWSWIQFYGGIDEPNGTDRITIRKGNEHGYREIIQAIPCDIAWGQRYERDAIAADQIADALVEVMADVVDDYHPAAGIPEEDAAIAADAVRAVAANLRKWREPLAKYEAFPVVENL